MNIVKAIEAYGSQSVGSTTFPIYLHFLLLPLSLSALRVLPLHELWWPTVGSSKGIIERMSRAREGEGGIPYNLSSPTHLTNREQLQRGVVRRRDGRLARVRIE
jgi:hypothetical protein